MLSTLSHPETHEKQKMAHLTFASKHLNFGLNKEMKSPKRPALMHVFTSFSANLKDHVETGLKTHKIIFQFGTMNI